MQGLFGYFNLKLHKQQALRIASHHHHLHGHIIPVHFLKFVLQT